MTKTSNVFFLPPGVWTHHGLVDEPSSLELDDPVGVGRVGPGVFYHAPFVIRCLDLHQRRRLGYGAGAGRDGDVLRHQLPAGASFRR